MAASYESVKEASQERANAELAQLDQVEDLVEQLDSLVDANGNVQEANKQQASYILGELNEALGTEYTMIGNQIEQYGALKDSVYDLIDAKKQEILMEQLNTDYEAAIKNVNEYQEHINALARDRDATQEELYQKQVERDRILKELTEENGRYINELERENLTFRLGNLEQEIRETEASLKEKQLAYDEDYITLAGYYEAIAAMEDVSTLQMQGKTDEILSLLQRRSGGFVEAKDLDGATEEERNRILSEQYAKAQQDLDNYHDAVESGTIEHNATTEKLLQENLEKAEEEWKTGMGDLETETEEGMDNIEKEVTEGGKDAEIEMSIIAENLSTAFAKTLAGRAWQAAEAMRQFMTAAKTSAEEELDINSPSKVMQRIGEYTGQGFEIGLRDSMGGIGRVIDQSLGLFESGKVFSVIPTWDSLSSPPLENIWATPGANWAGSSLTQNSSVTTNLGGVNVVVYGAPGQDVNELADIIMDKMETAVQRKGAVFS